MCDTFNSGFSRLAMCATEKKEIEIQKVFSSSLIRENFLFQEKKALRRKQIESV